MPQYNNAHIIVHILKHCVILQDMAKHLKMSDDGYEVVHVSESLCGLESASVLFY